MACVSIHGKRGGSGSTSTQMAYGVVDSAGGSRGQCHKRKLKTSHHGETSGKDKEPESSKEKEEEEHHEEEHHDEE